ncbi:MAG: pilus assembly protein PilM [Anaerotignum sp.]
MAKGYTGIIVGESSIKMVQINNGIPTKTAIETTPDNLVRDGRIMSFEALVDILKTMAKANQMKNKNAVIVLPLEECYLRRTKMPYMPTDQLGINLPYEFRDYIHTDQQDYLYDYAVVGNELDEEGKIASLELLIAAIKNTLIESYTKVVHLSGFKMKIALPNACAFQNIIRAYEDENPEHPRSYCIVDLGHSGIRVHLFKDGIYEATKVIDYGGSAIDFVIAENLDVDIHTASSYKIKNYENVQESEFCKELYDKMVIEILRSINFFNYNNQDSELRNVYFCGGLAKIDALMEMLRSTLEVQCHSIAQLMPELGEDENLDLICTAIGATLQ